MPRLPSPPPVLSAAGSAVPRCAAALLCCGLAGVTGMTQATPLLGTAQDMAAARGLQQRDAAAGAHQETEAL